MITIFNRTELFNTFSKKTQIKVRELLTSNNIDYNIQISLHKPKISLHSSKRSGRSEQMHNQYNALYSFYVEYKDYERAKYLITVLIKEK